MNNKGHYFTKREIKIVEEKGYTKVSCETYEDMLIQLQHYKSLKYFVKQGYESSTVRGVPSYFLYIKERVGVNTSKKTNAVEMAVKTDYEKILKESMKRVQTYVKKVVKQNDLTLNTPTLGVLEKTGGILGRCRGKVHIELEKRLLDSGIQNDIDSVMAHELLHCVKESKGHDKMFKSLMKQVNEIAPFEIHQYSNNTIEGNDELLQTYKYVAKCDTCGKVHAWAQRDARRIRYYKGCTIKCKDESCTGGVVVEVRE